MAYLNNRVSYLLYAVNRIISLLRKDYSYLNIVNFFFLFLSRLSRWTCHLQKWSSDLDGVCRRSSLIYFVQNQFIRLTALKDAMLPQPSNASLWMMLDIFFNMYLNIFVHVYENMSVHMLVFICIHACTHKHKYIPLSKTCIRLTFYLLHETLFTSLFIKKDQTIISAILRFLYKMFFKLPFFFFPSQYQPNKSGQIRQNKTLFNWVSDILFFFPAVVSFTVLHHYPLWFQSKCIWQGKKYTQNRYNLYLIWLYPVVKMYIAWISINFMQITVVCTCVPTCLWRLACS